MVLYVVFTHECQQPLSANKVTNFNQKYVIEIYQSAQVPPSNCRYSQATATWEKTEREAESSSANSMEVAAKVELVCLRDCLPDRQSLTKVASRVPQFDAFYSSSPN